MKRVMDNARQRGVQATLVTGEVDTTQVTYEFNRLKGIESTESLQHSLQVIKDGRLGIAGSTRPGGEEELLDKAIEVAQYGSVVGYEFPAPEPARTPKVYDEAVASFDVNDMIALGEELVSFMLTLDTSINGIAQIAKTVAKQRIGNTQGLDASLKKTTFTVVAGYQFTEGQNMLMSYDLDFATTLQYDAERIKGKLREDFEIGRKNVAVESGTYPVLFTPASLGDIARPVLACLDGRAVMRGISPFKDRIGEQLFHPSLTVVEDGTLDGGVGSGIYDSQGVACRRTPLIEQGVLKEYLLDLESASRLGRNPIGTGGPAGASANNLLVLPGKESYEDLIKNMDKGIIIDQAMGAWTGNPYTGMVSGNIALGFLVINGEKVGRVKDCMFTVNVFEHLKSHLLALSKESKNMGGAILPYLLLDNVSVSGRGK